MQKYFHISQVQYRNLWLHNIVWGTKVSFIWYIFLNWYSPNNGIMAKAWKESRKHRLKKRNRSMFWKKKHLAKIPRFHVNYEIKKQMANWRHLRHHSVCRTQFSSRLFQFSLRSNLLLSFWDTMLSRSLRWLSLSLSIMIPFPNLEGFESMF